MKDEAAERERKRLYAIEWRKKNPNYNREYDKANRERQLENARKWRAAHPDASLKWRQKNRERSRAYQRQWALANPERVKAKEAKYCKANRDTRNARSRKWYRDNQERSRASSKKWTDENPDRRRELRSKSTAKRRAKVAAAVENVSPKVVFVRDGYVCQLCGDATSGKHPDPLSPSLDHILPLSKGGDHSYANVQCAHLVCNLRKHDDVLAA